MLNNIEAPDLTHKNLATAIIRNPITVSPDMTVREAIALMSGARSQCEANSTAQSESNHLQTEARASCVLVVDARRVIGILTERDVVRLCAKQESLDSLLVSQVMTTSMLTLQASAFTDLFVATNLLQQNHIRHLPIVDEQDGWVGLVTHETLRQVLRPSDLLRLRLVREVMTETVITTEQTDSLLCVAQRMANHRVSSVVVVERDRPEGLPTPIGIVTERDLVQFQALALDFERYHAAQVMSYPVVSVPVTETLVTVQRLMERYFVRRVVVIGAVGELLGIVTQTNVLQAFSPLELYKLTEVLETRIKQLEVEKLDILQSRNLELEQQVTSQIADIHQRLQVEQVVTNVATAIRASLHLQTILDTAVEQIRQVVACDRANIWRFEPDFSTRVVAEATDSTPSLIGEQVQDTCYQSHIFQVYREGHIRVVPDIYTTEMADCHRELLIQLQTRAKVLVPLFCGDRLWGLLNVSESQTPRDWQTHEIDFLRTISTHLAIAIQQASTHDQLQAELQEHQQTEVHLWQKTKRLREAQRIAHLGSWELDLQHNTLYWSEECFRIFEVDPQQFDTSYEAFLTVVHPEDRETVNAAYSQHLRDRQPYTLVHRLQMADGRIKYVQEQCETTYSADGTPLISKGTVQDITQQQEADIRRDRAETSLRQVIEGTATFIGEDFFPALVRHISEALGVRYVVVSQAMAEGFQVLAFFADGELSPPPFLPYESVPCCRQALQTGSCCYPADIPTLYPDNILFKALQVESYLGIGLQNSAGEPMGNLCILHDRPLADPAWAQTLLSIFAARAGAEIERLLAAQALEKLNAELEERVTQRTAELAERETLLQDFLDNANDLIQIVNLDTGHFEFVNQAWRDVLGYTAAEVEQLTIFDVLAPDCFPHCQRVLEQMQVGALTGLEQVELTFANKAGQPVQVEGNINCRFETAADGSQAPSSTRAIFRDVTVKKAAEQELQRREARYRALLEGASDAILLANPEGYILEANQKAALLLGYDCQDLVGMHFTQLHAPEDLPHTVAAFESLATKKQYQILNVDFLRQDGRRIPVDVTASVIEVGGETIIQGIFHDIRERLQAEQALRESETRFRRVFESDVVGMIFTDFSGHISEANDCFLTMLGYTRQDLAAGDRLNWATLTPPEYIDQDEAAIAHLQHHDAIRPWEKVYRHKDGHLVPVLIGVAMLDSKEGTCVCVVVDIGDRKRYETALKESQQLLQTVLDTVPLAVFWKDQDSTYLGANRLFLRDADLTSSSELVGKTDFDMPWGATEAADYRADDCAVMDSEQAKLNIIESLHRQDGTKIWLETNKLPLCNLAGEVVGLLGTYQNITDRQNAKIALQRQLAAIEAAVNGIGILQDDRYEYLNSSHGKMFGYEADELMGQSWRVLYSSEELERFDQEIWPVLQQHMSWQGEMTATRKDGTTFPEQLSLTITADNLLIYVCQDISARKQSEAALKASEQRYVTLAQAVPVAIFRFDLEGRCIYVNEYWCEMTGKPASFATDGNWLKTLHPDDQQRTQTVTQQWLQSGALTPFQNEARILRDDGSIVWFYCQILLETNTNGQLIGYVGTLTDISDRKASELLIRQQANRAILLREITQRIRQSLDLPTIFDTTCQEIRQLLQADRAGIFRFYPESHWTDGEFVAESVAAGFVSTLAVRIHDHCFGEKYAPLYLQGRYAAMEDIHQLSDQCHIDVLDQFQVRANLVIPVLDGDNLWGLLCIHQCSSPRQWQSFEIGLMQQLAIQLTIAIQQASLYEQVQTELLERQQAEAKIALQLRRQQALATINQLILQQSLDLEHILATATQQVKEVLKGDRVIIFQLSPNGTSQIVEEAVSEGLPHLRQQHWDDEAWSQDILEWYWQGLPRIVPDVMDDRWTECLRGYSIDGRIQSKIVAPIVQEIRPNENHRWVSSCGSKKLWGVLVIHACTEKRVWLPPEAELLQQIANQMAIAIQQAHLFEQLQQELTERLQAQTQLTERNQQLAVTNQELARATRLKDEFLANMSHELRTPLNAILGMTEGLQDEVFGIVNESQIKALRTVDKSAAHLLALINDILDVAKIESGQVHLERSSVSIEQLCSSSLAFVKQQAFKKHIQLKTQIPRHLPHLFVDEIRMRQVLLNLLTNAVKFTLEGGTVTLTVSTLSSDVPLNAPSDLPAEKDTTHPTVLRIAVTDTGIGITPENALKLFKPFVQIDGALNRQQAGTGLGLALVKQIVELHGGRIELTSELGVGSCFAVDLPYPPQEATAPQADNLAIAHATNQPSPPEREAPSTQVPLVLLAEDNPANVAATSSYLEAKGYRLLFAVNGQEAIDLAVLHHPDVILMDVQMPGMDGLEAMTQIRQQASLRNTPIIALTALAMNGDRERCLAAGADSYLSKPVKLKQLDIAIKELLANRSLE